MVRYMGGETLPVDIDAAILAIDREISRQLDAILHHPKFQELEATWCGLRTLVESVPARFENASLAHAGEEETSEEGIVVSVLNVTKDELLEDLRYSDTVRSALYRKVYREAYNVFGGRPFAIVVGDFAFDDSEQDISLLEDISKVMASAFTVFVSAVDRAFFRVDRFSDLYRMVDTTRGAFSMLPEHLWEGQPRWNAMRSKRESRFLALTVPRMLMRRPYDYRRGLGCSASHAGWRDADSRVGWKYRESQDAGSRLWGNAAYGFAVVAVTCYAETGWLADIHGVPSDAWGGGLVARLPDDRDMLVTDPPGDVFKPATDVVVSDALEKTLTWLGFLTLSHRHGTGEAAFCNTPSLYCPPDPNNTDEQLSAMLHYTLCVSCFAHAIKRLGHHKVGSIQDAVQIKAVIDEFLAEYVLKNENAPREKKAQKPLRDFDVRVSRSPDRTGHFDCQIMLQLHHDLDAVRIELSTQLVGMERSMSD